MKELLIGIRTQKESGKEFIEAWHRAENGLPAQKPVQALYFDSLETIWRCLSPRRFMLLEVLHSSGELSIRKLAQTVGKDYKSIHGDIKELVELGLVERVQRDAYRVPWDKLLIDMPLPNKLAAAK